MSKKKEKISVKYKFIVMIFSFVTVVFNIYTLGIKDVVLYFTMLSNLACFDFYFICYIKYKIHKLSKDKTYYLLKGMITINITLTMAVYFTLIASSVDYTPLKLVTSMMAHLVNPLLVIFDYIIFGEKGHLEKEFPILWSISIIAYTLYCYLVMALGITFMNGDKYPYPYMNPQTNGISGVLVSYLSILIIYIIYGNIVIHLDSFVGKKKLGEK